MEQRKNKLFEHIPHWHVPQNVNDIHQMEQAASGFNQRLAVTITKGFGSIWAFYILVAWMLLWMALASAGVWLFARDSYPFSFLLFLSNLVQLWALPVLAVGQSVLGRHQELQSEEQFATTQKTYADIESIMKHLDKQDDAILEILRRLEGGRGTNEATTNATTPQP